MDFLTIPPGPDCYKTFTPITNTYPFWEKDFSLEGYWGMFLKTRTQGFQASNWKKFKFDSVRQISGKDP
jgi:hypothetical protein